jgi:Ran GTPase-activating protein 1
VRSAAQNGTDDDGGELNGNGQPSTDDSPNSQRDKDEDVEADNSILWSNSRLGGSFALNGSYRLEDAMNSTPGGGRYSNAGGAATSGRRFPPRPSPERLANQIRNMEVSQEKMVAAVVENGRTMVETQEAILQELRKTREDMGRNVRDNTEAVRDLRGEMNSLWRELREEMRRNASKKQEVVVIKQDPSAAAVANNNSNNPAHKPLDLHDLQEALSQQAALIQMSSLSMAGMFAQAARPVVPGVGAPPLMQPPPVIAGTGMQRPPYPGGQVIAPGSWPVGSQVPQHPLPPPPQQQNQNNHSSPKNVVITTSDKIPAANAGTNSPALAPVSIPAQHRLGGFKPAVAQASGVETSTTPMKPHEYQINLPQNANQQATSPFSDQEGPAVPITTSSIMSSIPAPAFSAVSKGHQQKTASSAVTKTTASAAASTSTPSGFDKFKPKPGSWECQGCFLRQAGDVIQCPACQTAKPGHEDEVKAKEETSKPTVSFGAEGGFKFNLPGATTSSPAPSSGFSFGTPPPTTTKTSTAEPAKPASTFAAFSFNTAGGSSTSGSGGGFSFSGVQPVVQDKPIGFSMNNILSNSSPVVLKKEESDAQHVDADEGHDDSANHDPHFEPIIPLPELVTVTTGEEDEEVTFKHRSKVFRFDKDTKEWKERGLGDLKILYHPDRHTFRILLRREQIFKIAINHYITVDMNLEPMSTSETALTWFAMDYSDEGGEAKMEKLAAKFKLAETKEEFKNAFESAQVQLRNRPPAASPAKAAASGVQDLSVVKKTDDVTADDNGELSFEGQSLKLNNANDAKDVVAKINAFKNMTTLTFSGNTVGIEAANAIGKALEKHPEFKNAHWKDMFTGRMKTEIPPALSHLSRGVMVANAQLVELDLSDNAFGPVGVDGIADLLKSKSCFTLKVLKLNNTGCGVTGGKKLAQNLLECYKASKGQLALRVFILGRSRQENEGGKALAEVFKLMGSLEEVVMPQNGIYFEGISALADAFASNPNLRILNMNDNTFTEKGAEALAQALPKLQKLQVLNLGDCLLKTEGARLIAYALKDGHSQLQDLHMDSNEIRVAGGFAIVDAIANKVNIQKLVIDTNQFGAEGCGRIMKKLTTVGKRHVLEEIEDDEEPDDSEEASEADDSDAEEDSNDKDDEQVEPTSQVQTLSSFSFTTGNTSKTGGSLFGGGSPAAKPALSEPQSSIFGGLKTTGTTSLFGGGSPASSASASPSLFGGFTGSTTATSGTTGIFGNKSPAVSGGLFGQSPAVSSSSSSTTTTTGIFGSSKPAADQQQPTSIFGSKPESTVVSQSAGIDLSASKDLASFASLGGGAGGSNTGSGGFAFGKKSDGFSFQGAGASVFGGGASAANKSPAVKQNDDGGEEEAGADHDPHFEPIVPLPELIEVTTGEEEEEVTFKHRSKVYR